MPSYPSTSTTPAVPASARSVVAMRAPGPWGPGAGGWALRVEGQRVSIVLQRAPMGIGAMVRELVIRLPHVALPFDFRDGVQCFQHHRGHAEAVEIAVEARLLLDWLFEHTSGAVRGRATGDTLTLVGRTASGTRYSARARLLSEPAEEADATEPTVLLSLYEIRAFGAVDAPWPALASEILDRIPEAWVADRTLTTVRLKVVRRVLAWVLSELGWKLPEVRGLEADGVELRDGLITARFTTPEERERTLVTVDAVSDGGASGAFERFVEDLELKRHHSHVDRLLGEGRVRDALAEAYRALDGPIQPGFVAERIVGMCVSLPVLHDEGERVCRVLLESEPTSLAALAGLASIALARGQREEAAVQLERASACLEGPVDAEAATAVDLTLADILRELDPVDARAALDRVLERTPDHEGALEALVSILEATGDAEAAVPFHKRLLFAARSPERTRTAGLRLAAESLARRQSDEARVFLEMVFEASPRDIEATLLLADVEVSVGAPHRAVRLLEETLRGLSANDGEPLGRVTARLARAWLEGMDDMGRARRALWHGVDAVGLTPEARLALALLAVRVGEPDLAERYAREIADDHEAHVQARCVRADAALLTGDHAAALDHLLTVLEVAPDSAEALARVDRCAVDGPARERLLDVLQRSKVGDPAGQARVSEVLGRLYESLDLGWDAIAPYEAVLANPDGLAADVEAGARLLGLYEEHGMWAQHQALCERLTSAGVTPDQQVTLWVRQARVALEELNATDEARRLLDEAVRTSPRNVEALMLLMRAIEVQGDAEALDPVLRRVIALHPAPAVRLSAGVRLVARLLDGDGTLGEARAVLLRLPEQGRGMPRVEQLRARAGMDAAPPPPLADSARPVGVWDQALALADEGDAQAAQALLDGHAGDPALRTLMGAVKDGVHGPAAASDVGLEIARHLAAARAAFGSGAMAEARRAAEAALELETQGVESLELLGAICQELGDLHGLERVLAQFAERTYDELQLHGVLRERAQVLEEGLNDGPRALALWRRCVSLYPRDQDAAEHAAALMMRDSDWEGLAQLHGARARDLVDASLRDDDSIKLRQMAARARLAEAGALLDGLALPEGAVVAAQAGLDLAAGEEADLLAVLMRAAEAAGDTATARAAARDLIDRLKDGPLRDEASGLLSTAKAPRKKKTRARKSPKASATKGRKAGATKKGTARKK